MSAAGSFLGQGGNGGKLAFVVGGRAGRGFDGDGGGRVLVVMGRGGKRFEGD